MTHRTALIMAGGTGGHIFPALAVASALKQRGWKIVWLGAAGAMETRLVPEQDPEIILETGQVSGVRRKGWLKWLMLPWVQGKAFVKAASILFRYRPDVVIGFGGFTSFAGGIAAKSLRKPLLIHEQNAVAGLTNRILAKVANQVLFAFPSAFPGREGLIGNPLRQSLLALPEPVLRFAERSGPLNILVIGGSLGATILNTQVPKALALFDAATRPNVIHQAGAQHIGQLEANYRAARVNAQCVPFIGDMAQALSRADLVVCRCGALTVSELAAVGVAAILVPFAAAVDDHQTANARYLSEAGAGIVIAQSALTPEALVTAIRALTRQQLLLMAQKARMLAKPHATEVMVANIERLAKIT